MIIGEKHGRLTCIGKDDTRDSRYYLFQCDCGNIKSIIAYNVIHGATSSCGCIVREKPNHTTHGFSHTRLDNIYKTMIDRCTNPRSRNFKNYGGRGIYVCDEWKNDKTSFFSWALSNGYSEKLTLDRIDNNKGYCPDNCRWATYKQQANNKRKTRRLSAFGETHTISEWGEITGIKYETIWARLKRGWLVEKALTADVI